MMNAKGINQITFSLERKREKIYVCMHVHVQKKKIHNRYHDVTLFLATI